MADSRRAEGLLNALVGKAIISIESSEYQLRLVFEKSLEFVVPSPWRVLLRGALLGGSGDVGGANAEKVLDSIKGLKVTLTSVSPSWDTRLVLEKDYILEVIPDSLQYEIWKAHIEAGWVVFVGGELTLFPPATSAVGGQATKVNVYGAGGSSLAQETVQVVTDIMQGIEGLRSIGIATPSPTGCTRASHRQSEAFDVVELNGTPSIAAIEAEAYPLRALPRIGNIGFQLWKLQNSTNSTSTPSMALTTLRWRRCL